MMNFEQALAEVKAPKKLAALFAFGADTERLRRHFQTNYPLCMKALKLIDRNRRNLKRGAGFSLLKRESKKYGFLYYVRYLEEGRVLPSMWCTHTNKKEEAEKFAVENRERLLTAYCARHGRTPKFYTALEAFYQKNSKYLIAGKPLGERRQRLYYNFVTKRFIPYLKEREVYRWDDLSAAVIKDFRRGLSESGIKPQTVNDYLCGVKRICDYFTEHEELKENPFSGIKMLPVSAENKSTHGCYEIPQLGGAFNESWENSRAYILNLLIYTTDMRPIEIESLRLSDIVTIEDCRFFDIKRSKTSNGVRRVPLHNFVYEKIVEFAKNNNRQPDETIIPRKGNRLSSDIYREANEELGRRLGVETEELKKENLTFYSGRHFWKTLMNSEGLGSDIEEVFMGHKVSSDVKKRYNHKDKRGKERVLEAARTVFKILDENIFQRGQEAVHNSPGGESQKLSQPD